MQTQFSSQLNPGLLFETTNPGGGTKIDPPDNTIQTPPSGNPTPTTTTTTTPTTTTSTETDKTPKKN